MNVTTLQDFKADLFRTLANPQRIRILELLRAATSLTVGEIQLRLETPANVSQHLAIMRSQGLVVGRRDGTSVWYTVADPKIFDLLDTARNLFESQLKSHAAALEVEDASRR